ncbi:hypothetical protein POX_d05734 [Penicillium oxalicum]|uniref:Uncharacterized protein n=1 Tax=Penicillium oxalicum (strain 114-2 / CGMCC 5302) TaxID=933388 RepID=S7ZTJ4_PENO1|nr:hypothetical protein POX_d05734 [Penicillium oxalicum]EPS32091.1 hypothetical protein PDE_07050 [Penicillium oxalicum 114-2]KAI2790227.1 hypothetical protein POX_d05734 [Penicillium oxalicum]
MSDTHYFSGEIYYILIAQFGSKTSHNILVPFTLSSALKERRVPPTDALRQSRHSIDLHDGCLSRHPRICISSRFAILIYLTVS